MTRIRGVQGASPSPYSRTLIPWDNAKFATSDVPPARKT